VDCYTATISNISRSAADQLCVLTFMVRMHTSGGAADHLRALHQHNGDWEPAPSSCSPPLTAEAKHGEHHTQNPSLNKCHHHSCCHPRTTSNHFCQPTTHTPLPHQSHQHMATTTNTHEVNLEDTHTISSPSTYHTPTTTAGHRPAHLKTSHTHKHQPPTHTTTTHPTSPPIHRHATTHPHTHTTHANTPPPTPPCPPPRSRQPSLGGGAGLGAVLIASKRPGG
jgi:hypothetical protein